MLFCSLRDCTGRHSAVRSGGNNCIQHGNGFAMRGVAIGPARSAVWQDHAFAWFDHSFVLRIGRQREETHAPRRSDEQRPCQSSIELLQPAGSSGRKRAQPFDRPKRCHARHAPSIEHRPTLPQRSVLWDELRSVSASPSIACALMGAVLDRRRYPTAQTDPQSRLPVRGPADHP